MVENQNSTPDSSAGAPSDHLDDVEGIVKWFDPRKGFGFIVGPQGQDIFVHFQVIAGDGFRALKDGSSVVYSAQKTDKGWKATKVARGSESTLVKVPDKAPHVRSPRR